MSTQLRKKYPELIKQPGFAYTPAHTILIEVRACACVSVCAKERERGEGQGQRGREREERVTG